MKQAFFLSLVITLLFCACGKDSNDTTTPVVPTPNDSIYLRKVVALDTTKTAPLDTLYMNYYTFDNSHRLITDKLVNYENTATVTESYITTYFYNGADSLPFKSIENDLIPSIETITRFFIYQPGTRKVILDSLIYDNGDRFVVSQVFSGDSYASYNDVYNSSGQQHNGPFYTTIIKQNGNIISQADTTSGTTKEDYNCSYDNHPNPFYNIAWYSNTLIPSIYKSAPDCFGLNNNVTEININSGPFAGPPGFHSDYTYSWTYRTDGYPVEASRHDNGSSNPDNINKIKFFYTN